MGWRLEMKSMRIALLHFPCLLLFDDISMDHCFRFGGQADKFTSNALIGSAAVQFRRMDIFYFDGRADGSDIRQGNLTIVIDCSRLKMNGWVLIDGSYSAAAYVKQSNFCHHRFFLNHDGNNAFERSGNRGGNPKIISSLYS